jgi:hypothetical protein
MRIVSRGMATSLAALSLTGGALAAPVETVLYRARILRGVRVDRRKADAR